MAPSNLMVLAKEVLLDSSHEQSHLLCSTGLRKGKRWMKRSAPNWGSQMQSLPYFRGFFFPTKRRQFRPVETDFLRKKKNEKKTQVRRFPENVYPFHHSMAGSEESCQNHSKSQVKKDIKFWWLILIPWQDFKKSLIPRVFAAFHLAECRDPTWRTPLYIYEYVWYMYLSHSTIYFIYTASSIAGL